MGTVCCCGRLVMFYELQCEYTGCAMSRAVMQQHAEKTMQRAPEKCLQARTRGRGLHVFDELPESTVHECVLAHGPPLSHHRSAFCLGLRGSAVVSSHSRALQ
jgi:hypothetical protein